MPIIAGSTPALAWPARRARIGRPSWLARASLINITAAAPSFSAEALPAVTVPSFLKAARRPPRDSAVVSPRGCSSVSTIFGSPLRCGTSTGVISFLKRPSLMAAAAFRWEAAAKASWASRLRLYFCARFSAVMPIWKSLKASHRPS